MQLPTVGLTVAGREISSNHNSTKTFFLEILINLHYPLLPFIFLLLLYLIWNQLCPLHPLQEVKPRTATLPRLKRRRGHVAVSRI